MSATQEREADGLRPVPPPRGNVPQADGVPAPDVRDQAPSADAERPEPEGDVAVHGQPETDAEALPPVSAMSASIISLVADLGRQLDAAYEVKGTLEAELAATRQELEETGRARRELESRVEELAEQLDASTTQESTSEPGAATSSGGAAQLREELALASQSVDELRAQCEELRAENLDAREANQRFGQAFDGLTAQYRAARSGLGAAKKALNDIHAAAARIHGRHQRPTEAGQAQPEMA